MLICGGSTLSSCRLEAEGECVLELLFAFHVVQFTLASLVHAFEMTTPTDEHVDMTEGFGFNNVKMMPFEVLLTPRLPPEVYEGVNGL